MSCNPLSYPIVATLGFIPCTTGIQLSNKEMLCPELPLQTGERDLVPLYPNDEWVLEDSAPREQLSLDHEDIPHHGFSIVEEEDDERRSHLNCGPAREPWMKVGRPKKKSDRPKKKLVV